MTNRVGLASALLAIGLVASACGADDPVIAGPGALGHIHDMVVEPDSGLLVASHSGLYRIAAIDRAELVNAEQHDLMAMTALNNGDLLVGGHPDLRLDKYIIDGRPPFLGLTTSTDSGETWQVLDLLGETDFHAIVETTAGLFVAETSGRIMFRDVAGNWADLGEMQARDLAIDPTNSDLQIAPDYDAALWASTDGAATWEPIAGSPALLEVEWTAADRLVGIDGDGAVWDAREPGGPWTNIAAGPTNPETLLIEGGSWWVSVRGGAIFRTDDEGSTWLDVYVPPTEG